MTESLYSRMLFGRLLARAACLVVLPACGIVTKGALVDVIQPDRTLHSINMAPRHYKSLDHCKDILQAATPSLLASVSPLTDDQKKQLEWPTRVAAYRPSDCDSFRLRGKILSDFTTIYSGHNYKIGFILPPAAANESALQLILDQLKSTLRREGISDDNALIIRRVEKSEASARKAIAEMIHIDRVSAIISINSLHLGAAVKLADATQTPVFLVNPAADHSLSRQSMRVYPPMSKLAQKLLDQYRSRGISHVSVLYPKNGDLDLYDQLKISAQGQIFFMPSSYDPNSPNDILATTRGVASRMALVKSKAQGLLILDNFKMVRHVVNIIREPLSEMKVLITGNQQWRSTALITPREEALEGALFVDFIGSYAVLPRGLEVPMPESAYFTTAQAASRIDYQIIGYRLGTLSAQILNKNWNRQRIAHELQAMNNHWDDYFPREEKTFDTKRDSAWPAFLFTIQGESIVPDHSIAIR